MKRKILSIIASLYVLAILFYAYSSGPSPDYTNRAGSNCTSCHIGTLNSGTGSVSISAPASYTPGQSYTITVTSTGANVYGFQMTAVQTSSTSTGAGTFSSGTGIKTNTQGGRSYATHSFKSTAGVWNVTWTAPSSPMGNVTFYASSVIGNNNGGNSGDRVFATTQTITGPTPVTATKGSSNPTCPSGSDGYCKVSNVTGGSGSGYTYQWSGSSVTGDSLGGLSSGNYTVTITDGASNTKTYQFTLQDPATMQVSFGETKPDCGYSNGALSARVTNGTGPYNFSWDDPNSTQGTTVNNLRKGWYRVTVTDANLCSVVDSFELKSGKSLLNVSLVTSKDFCGASLGQIQTNVTGALGNVAYSWNTMDTTAGLDSISSGNYGVTVSDTAGCTGFAQVALQDSIVNIQGVINTLPDNCNQSDGMGIATNITGGTSPYSFAWGNGDTTDTTMMRSSGSIFVTISDIYGCNVSLSGVVNLGGGPTLTMHADSALCYGDTNGLARVDVSGGVSPYSYQWNNSTQTDSLLEQVVKGLYAVTVTDQNGCFAFDSIEVRQPDSLSLTLSAMSTAFGLDTGYASVLASGGSSPYSYVWDDLVQQTDSLARNLSPRQYTVKVTDKNTCVKFGSITVEGFVAASVTESELLSIRPFPNPVRETLHFGAPLPTTAVIVNSNGGVVKNLEKGVSDVDVSELPAGRYLLMLGDPAMAKTINIVIVD